MSSRKRNSILAISSSDDDDELMFPPSTSASKSKTSLSSSSSPSPSPSPLPTVSSSINTPVANKSFLPLPIPLSSNNNNNNNNNNKSNKVSSSSSSSSPSSSSITQYLLSNSSSSSSPPSSTSKNPLSLLLSSSSSSPSSSLSPSSSISQRKRKNSLPSSSSSPSPSSSSSPINIDDNDDENDNVDDDDDDGENFLSMPRKNNARSSSSASSSFPSPSPSPPLSSSNKSKRTKSSKSSSKSPNSSKSKSSKSSVPSSYSPLTSVSTDRSVVLRHVESLSTSMIDEKSPTSLSDLNLPNIRMEVSSMSDAEVRLQIEQLVVWSLNTILRGDGYEYLVPSRSASNQLYVSEIDRFVLKDKISSRVFASIKNGRKTALTTRVLQLVYELCCKGIHVTKRDLFYTDVRLFTTQTDSDAIIDDVATMVGCTRSSLNVVAAEKGIVVGRVKFDDDGDPIDCTKQGVGGKAIPPSIDRVSNISGDAKFILLVEKDAAFMRLAEDRFYNTYPCVIITGKGQPDVATRLFVKKVKETLNIPVLALMDADPYGLKILSVYMSGSKNMSYDSANLTTRDIKWLGVRPSDLERYHIPTQCRIPLSDHDIKFGKELLKEEFIMKNPKWEKELRMMIETKEKAEIQALSTFGFQYLTHTYLPLKLQQGDWI